jgi:hypothetical protein
MATPYPCTILLCMDTFDPLVQVWQLPIPTLSSCIWIFLTLLYRHSCPIPALSSCVGMVSLISVLPPCTGMLGEAIALRCCKADRVHQPPLQIFLAVFPCADRLSRLTAHFQGIRRTINSAIALSARHSTYLICCISLSPTALAEISLDCKR